MTKPRAKRRTFHVSNVCLNQVRLILYGSTYTFFPSEADGKND